MIGGELPQAQAAMLGHLPPPLVARVLAQCPRQQRISIVRCMEGMRELASIGRHFNVLQHLMGFLKEKLDGEDKAELLGVMEDYRHGQVPLIVPVTLLKHHLRRHEVPEWVHQQVYLYPYPKELMLRNHV